jgi:hypothetical protein
MSKTKPANITANANQSNVRVEWRYFCVGVVFLFFGIGLALWAFSKGQLTSDQRVILLWALPMISGFVCGSFTGAITVNSKGFWPGVAATATGGFGVWLLTYLMLPKVDVRAMSLSEYKAYILDKHRSNVASLTNAIKNAPGKSSDLEDGKAELDETKSEVVKNVDEHPGLPTRHSIQKYNKTLEELKGKAPSFKPEYLILDPEQMEKQRKAREDHSL